MALVQPENNMIDVFSSPDPSEKDTQNYELDPKSVIAEDFPPIVTPEIQASLDALYSAHPHLRQEVRPAPFESVFEKGEYIFNPNEAWIQTYSGRRFTPTNPNPDAIVIQDIAHSLSMQCRFSGHTNKFYSVAQHSVLVSYLCNHEDALWGLLHDASEAYLVDVPRPLKRSNKFDAYLEFESLVQRAVCIRFNLDAKEPASVKKADAMLLATEARDLMSPLRDDWVQALDPLPFKIDPLPPQEAKNLFMKRFFELNNMPAAYQRYLSCENK